MINGEDLPFCTTPNDNKELWPILLEKAYAKKYGSFENIEGGYTSFALSELTNGIPEFMYR